MYLQNKDFFLYKSHNLKLQSLIFQSPDMLDLNYDEDSKAQVDANFVICDSGEISEIQVTGEEFFFTDDQFSNIFDLAKKGIKEIIEHQKKILA